MPTVRLPDGGVLPDDWEAPSVHRLEQPSANAVVYDKVPNEWCRWPVETPYRSGSCGRPAYGGPWHVGFCWQHADLALRWTMDAIKDGRVGGPEVDRLLGKALSGKRWRAFVDRQITRRLSESYFTDQPVDLSNEQIDRLLVARLASGEPLSPELIQALNQRISEVLT